ncbi:MAG: hypothetical protein GC200_01845 [Tepidisphaera sp.]|nr:hypothetical protein [Tepidisphaera sp.]
MPNPPRRSRPSRPAVLAAAAALLGFVAITPLAAAQPSCDGTWVPTLGPTGVDGYVYAMAKWDPDGPGPLPMCAVMGGTFAVAGDSIAANIALWNPDNGQFSPLGGGVNGRVRTIAALPDGRLVVGGDFSMAGSTPANRVAIWNGTSWSALGAGIDNNPPSRGAAEVDSVTGLADNSVIVAGNIYSAGGVMTGSIARWDGQTWSSLGSTPFTDWSGSLAIDPISHDLFAAVGGSAMRWDGTSWAAVPGGVGRYNFSFDDAGNLYSATSGGILARWDRSSWTNFAFSNGYFECVLGTDPGLCSSAETGYQVVGQRGLPRLSVRFSGGSGSYGMSSDVYCMLRSTNQTMLAGGKFTSYGSLQGVYYSQYPTYVPSVLLGQPARFENGTLRPLRPTGAFIFPGKLIRLDDGTIATIERGRLGVYTYDPSGSWTNQPFDRSFFCGSCGRFQYVEDIAPIPGGGMVAIQGDAVYSSRDGDGFVRIGTSNNLIVDFHPNPQAGVLPNGDIVVASPDLTVINSVPVHGFARWDGQTWSDMCSGFALSTPGYGNFVVAVAPNGDLVVAGNLVNINGVPVRGVARWDGSNWHALSDCGLESVSLLTIGGNGHIVVSGVTPAPAQLAMREWNGSAWTSIEAPFHLGTSGGYLYSLATRTNGDIVAAGLFDSVGTSPAANIARWDGFSWRPISDGLPTLGGYGSGVTGLVVASDDTVFAGGDFSHSGNTVSYGLAHAVFGAGAPPTITQQPENYATCFGYDAMFHVAAASSGALAYHWTLDGTPIDAALNPSALTDTLIIADGARPASYRCVVSNGCGSVTSDAVTPFEHPCCPDYNYDGVVDQGDIDAMILLMEDQSPVGKNPDFNQDGVFDQGDVDALITVIAGGPCP